MRVFFVIILLLFELNSARAEDDIHPAQKATHPSTKQTSNSPILLQADQITYQEKIQTVVASGQVEVSQYVLNQGWRTLHADEISYDKGSGQITAVGNVWLQEPSGEIVYAEQVNFQDDFKEGVIQTLRILTSDKAHLAAIKAHKQDENHSIFENAIYTPCNVCKEDPSRAPLWQIKAEQVVHDKEQQKVIYRNARLEIKGLPVFYVPYFSHPDPSVKRKSGLLFPVYGMSNDLGGIVTLPVYYSIAPNRDLTITPILTTKQNPILAAEYRHRFHDGEARVAGSYTRTKNLAKNQLQPYNAPRSPKPDRWHFMGQTRYDISDERRAIININRASDTTYLSRYPIINRQTPTFIQRKNLTSTATFEQFKENNYFGLNGYAFQTDAPKTTPLILPSANYHAQREPDRWGGILSFNANMLSLSRQTPVPGRLATQMQRISAGTTWKLPYVTRNGQLLTLQLSGRGDGYYTRRYQHASDAPVLNSNRSVERTTGRFFPQASLDWRYPLVKKLEKADWVLQPMAMGVASPYSLNNRHIPNEDSNSFELDDTTLFLPNRFDGIDRVDSGHRAVYGIENSFHLPQQKSASVFLGQTKRLDHRKVVPDGLGEDSNHSDYIGRIKIKPHSLLTARYRTSIKRKNGRPRYSELGTTIGDERLKLDLGYVYLSKAATVKKQDISQINWQLSTKAIDNWSLSLAQIRNLKRNRGGSSLANFILATYKDECFQVDAGVYRTSYRDRDIQPDSGFLIQLTFKNLGAFTPVTAPKYPGSMLTNF